MYAPPALHPVPAPAVQLITGTWSDRADLTRRVEAALRGGIRWVQLRARHCSTRELHDAAVAIAPLLREAHALFVVNDRVDVALSAGADGVHLPEDGMSGADARALLGDSAWIARSVHSVEAIRELAEGQIDAVQFGPVFDTASKRGFGPPHGLGELAIAAVAARSRSIAPVAVGGITAERAAECLRAGVSAISVIGAIWDAGDIEAAAQTLVRAVAA